MLVSRGDERWWITRVPTALPEVADRAADPEDRWAAPRTGTLGT